MKSFTLTAILSLFCFISAGVAQQKIAFINSAMILSEMPEVKSADTEMEAMRSQSQKKLEQRVTAWQAKVQDLQRKSQSGELSPKQQSDEETRLTNEQQEISKLEQDMTESLQKKRDELLQPIYDKVNEAITAMAKEKGWDIVFDASPGILYVNDAIDATDMVKTKLGLK